MPQAQQELQQTFRPHALQSSNNGIVRCLYVTKNESSFLKITYSDPSRHVPSK